MVKQPHLNKIIIKIRNNRNVALPKLVDAALKFMRKEY